jgi:hypothetical protein
MKMMMRIVPPDRRIGPTMDACVPWRGGRVHEFAATDMKNARLPYDCGSAGFTVATLWHPLQSGPIYCKLQSMSGSTTGRFAIEL